MFKFNQLRQIHLEISNNCQASCPMCSRNVNGGGENPLIKVNDWTLDQYKLIMTATVLQQLESCYFCGTFGDPMMNNDLIAMVRYSAEINPNLQIHIHTNGGARATKWWAELAQALPKNHLVIFGIDGLSDTHHIYRIGTQFDNVIKNAKSFIDAGGSAEWAFIKFKHNEHQVDQAQKLAKDLGFKTFNLKNSSRFLLEPRVKATDRQGKLMHYIEPATDTPLKFIDKKTIDNYQKITNDAIIECKVLETKEIYIDAHGDFFACCWLANTPYTYISEDAISEVRKKMLDQHTEMMEKLGETNMFKRSIEDIINSTAFQSIWQDMWTGSDKSIVCARSCGRHPDAKISKCTDQFLETYTLNE